MIEFNVKDKEKVIYLVSSFCEYCSCELSIQDIIRLAINNMEDYQISNFILNLIDKVKNSICKELENEN